LTDPATWRDAVTGSDVLFHLAAETDVAADRARHELVTVHGTQAALDAARYAKVPRFVHCGSEAALLAGDPLIDVDETAPLRPDSPAAYCAANAVEGLMLGWQRGRPGQAYFVTDQHRVVLREFLETLFAIYGVDTPIADLDAETAAREVPVPARWFLGQPCILRTDKAAAELGYKPLVTQAAGLDAVRDRVTVSGT
jgi:nucleoside-diphosphate-sugar epimerase